MNYTKVLIFAITLSLSNYVFCQDATTNKFNSRDIKIFYSIDDSTSVAVKQLYVTTDNGKSWQRAEDIGMVYWGADEKGSNYAFFSAPQNGMYGFSFRFGDNPATIE